MDELRLNEPGDDGAEEPGVPVPPDAGVRLAVALAAAAAAAAVGLHWAQMKMVKPRPLHLVQIEPLGRFFSIGPDLVWFLDCGGFACCSDCMGMGMGMLWMGWGGMHTLGHSLRSSCMSVLCARRCRRCVVGRGLGGSLLSWPLFSVVGVLV